MRTSLAGRLARMGMADVPRAERALTGLGIADDEGLLAALATAADPDLALASISRVAERDRAVLREARHDAAFRDRLIAALGASAALAGHLVRHPADHLVLCGEPGGERPEPRQVRAELLRAVGADPGEPQPRAAAALRAADHASPSSALAAAYHRRLLHLAARALDGLA
jgi:glutamate-ammonia-ligase adenylyltransferase